MSIYIHSDEIEPGVLVKAMSRDNEIVPALIVSFVDDDATSAFVRVLSTDGETYIMNATYLEHWK